MIFGPAEGRCPRHVLPGKVALIDDPAMAHHEHGVEARSTASLKLRPKPTAQLAIHALRIRCPDHPAIIEVRRVRESLHRLPPGPGRRRWRVGLLSESRINKYARPGSTKR